MTKSNIRRLFRNFFILVIFVIPVEIVQAQSTLHMSGMINFEIMDQKGPGYDLTVLYKGIWGVRFSQMSDLLFHETVDEMDSKVTHNTFQGDIVVPTLIKTLDFRQFKEGPNKIFDFITAYLGIGYNQQSIDLKQKEYLANANSLTSTKREEQVNASIKAISFGIYGGENLLVVDLRLQYLRGETEKTDYVDTTEFDKWMILASIGIGF